MFGYKLDQCIKAVESSLALLTENDRFNILVYNSYVSTWNVSPVVANSTNIDACKTYLGGLSSRSGSRMDEALNAALVQITDDDYSNAVVVLTDGRSPIDPRNIEAMNVHKAGIFPVGIGDDLDRARLEMTAALNYGFVTYFNDDDPIRLGMERLLHKISRPLMRDVVMEFGRADLHDILPQKYPSLYAGACFNIAGRYANAAVPAGL